MSAAGQLLDAKLRGRVALSWRLRMTDILVSARWHIVLEEISRLAIAYLPSLNMRGSSWRLPLCILTQKKTESKDTHPYMMHVIFFLVKAARFFAIVDHTHAHTSTHHHVTAKKTDDRS